MLLWVLACGVDRSDEPLEPAQVELGPVVTCAAPNRGSPYDTVRLPTSSNQHPWIWGGGLLVADLQGDEALEVWVTTEQGIRAYTVVGGSLVPIEAPSGLTFGTGAVAADVDGDGDLDVFVSRWAGAPADPAVADGADRLLRNDGDNRFTEIAGLEGCRGPCTRSVPASFGDLDHDGDLDLFVGSHGDMVGGLQATEQADGDPSHLYLNQGDGTFHDASAELPPNLHDGYTLGGGFVDFDGDGWLDLFAAHDLGRRLPNVVLWNRGGRLVPGDGRGLEVATNAMGLALGDLNADGLPEVVIPAWNEVVYLESLADREAWVDGGAARGITLEERAVTWGAELADLDNDGDHDLVVAAGWLHAFGTPDWANRRWQSDLAWRNDGTPEAPAFVRVEQDWGLDDPAVHRAFAVADLNRDGFLDLLVHDLEGELTVHWARCTEASWLRVVLRDETSANVHGVGARVEVQADGRVWHRTVRAGGTSMGVGLPPEVHVGLGSVAEVERVVVRWPNGGRSEVQDVGVGREVRVVRAPEAAQTARR